LKVGNDLPGMAGGDGAPELAGHHRVEPAIRPSRYACDQTFWLCVVVDCHVLVLSFADRRVWSDVLVAGAWRASLAWPG
jgi:hypothetical protein